MKKLYLILALLISLIVRAGTYYVATNGNDANPGTLSAPFATLKKALSLNLVAGDIVYLRAGTYKSGATTGSNAWLIDSKNGLSTAPITVSYYPPDFTNGGRVFLDCGDVVHQNDFGAFAIQNSSWIVVRGIRVANIPQTAGVSGTGSHPAGWVVLNSRNILLDNCEADHTMAGYAILNSNDVTFNNCDAHHLDDPLTNNGSTGPHNNADGFDRTNPVNTSTNTIYRGCRAWWCSDDGWDCYGTNGVITYDNCWSFWNGYNPGVYPLVHTAAGDGNGFKMGGTGVNTGLTRFARNCISAKNYNNGFDQNDGSFVAQFYNNLAYGNRGNDYKFGFHPPLAHVFRNNLSYGNCPGLSGCVPIDGLSSDAAAWGANDHNSWNGFTFGAADFVSLVDSQLVRTRKPNGDLPDITFGKLIAGSVLIDKGAIVGIPYLGSAPDIGSFEFGGTITVPPPPGVTVLREYIIQLMSDSTIRVK